MPEAGIGVLVLCLFFARSARGLYPVEVSFTVWLYFFTESNLTRKVNISLSIETDTSTLPDAVQTTLFRIAQEQINNILKLSKAKGASIHLSDRGDFVTPVIEDNGKGFDPLTKKGGIGIRNICYCAEKMQGTADFISASGNGCILKVRVPRAI